MPQIDTPHQVPAATVTHRRRLPPYGKELMAMREAGLVPGNSMVVVSLDSWSYGRAYSRCVVPRDLDPADTDFSFVAGLDVILVFELGHTMEARRDDVIRALLKCLPTTLRVCEVDLRVMTWTWIKSRAFGIELEEFK